MNCKGIIEKYRKTNDLFKVCLFNVESGLGKGSRFYFRLPAGIRKSVSVLLVVLFLCMSSCRHAVEQTASEEVLPDSLALLAQNEYELCWTKPPIMPMKLITAMWTENTNWLYNT